MTRPRLRSVPSQFAMCRAFQHAWDYLDVQRDGRVLIQSLRCMRCATVKYIKIDSRDGDTVGHPSYHYTDGYQLKEGGSMTHRERTAIRLAEIRGNLKGDV